MAVIHVSGGGDALKNAVSGALSGDVILVADGTYNPIALNEFGSKSLTIRSDHGPSKCIIDGEGTTMCINGNRGVSVYGVTFANGYVGNGGVVYRASAYQCIFRDCVVLGYGGVAYEGQSIFDCVFDNCISGRLGVVSSCPSIKRCLFRNCHAIESGNEAGAIINDGADVDSCVFESCGNGSEYILVSILGGTMKNCLFLNIPAEIGTGKCIVKYGKILECVFMGCGARTSMFVDDDDIERNVFLPMPANTKVSNIERTFSSNVVNGNVLFGGSSATTVQPITGNVVSGVISIPAGSPAKVAGNMTNVQSLPPFWGGPGGMPEMPSDPESLIANFPALNGIGPSWMWGGGGVKYKPYDAEVEYIESTGTQYIDTGLTNIANIAATIRFAVLSKWNQNSTILGVYTTTTTRVYSFGIDSGLYACNFGGSWNSEFAPKIRGLPLNSFVVASSEISSAGVTINANGTTMSTTRSDGWSGAGNLTIFKRGGVGQTNYAQIKLAMLEIRVSGTLVRDFVPVRVGSGANAVGYLYDRANPTGGPLGNGLYPNAGTGLFVIGPDIG